MRSLPVDRSPLPDWARVVMEAELKAHASGGERELYQRLEAAAKESIKKLLTCPTCGHVKEV